MSIAGNNQNFIIIVLQTITSKPLFVLRQFVRSHLRSGIYILFLCTFMIMPSCYNAAKQANVETPTSGNIRIEVDESFQPLLDTEVFTFTTLYHNARIKPVYKPEVDIVNDFMNDSVPVIVTSRKLTDSQIQYLRDSLIVARTTPFAYDALALITNKENKDTLLKYDVVKDIFTGKVQNWKDIDPKSRLGQIRVVFDNNKSGNIRYFKELFNIDSLGKNFFAVNTNPEVIDFVSRNPDALGIISVNWISDKNDSLSMSFVKKVNVEAVSQPYMNDGYYYMPLQGSIYEKSYPFVREVYLISRETFIGLGSGFIQWATAEQGQRIVLKSGLVPATMPIRLVQIKHE
jgi:phosphate transport system substrate-binding protein